MIGGVLVSVLLTVVVARAELASPEPGLLLAQAEPSPRESAPSTEPVPADPGPAEAAPAEGPPGAPPGTGMSPGAASAVPSTDDRPPPPPNSAALLAGFGYRLSSGPDPKVGFSIGGSFQQRYATLASVLEAGWAFEFLFDRFSTTVDAVVSTPGGGASTFTTTRTINDTSFAALQTLGTRTGPWRFWIGAGGGFSVGFFSSPEAPIGTGTANAYQPFARAAAGAEVAVSDQSAVGLRAGYSLMLTSADQMITPGQTAPLVGDLLDIQLGLFYRFR